MAIHVWKNAKIYMGQYDISSNLNAVALDYTNELLDASAMGVGATRLRVAGFKNVTCEINGFWDITPDLLFYTQVGLIDTVLTVCPETGAGGERCFFYKPALSTYAPGGSVGELLAFRISADCSEPLKRGTIILPKTTISGNGTGTPYQVGALSAAQTMYGVLHVFSATGGGDTLDVTIQSDNLEAFGDPTNQIVFTQVTAAGHEQKTKAGAVADTWWRVSYTVAGAGASFDAAVVVAIL